MVRLLLACIAFAAPCIAVWASETVRDGQWGDPATWDVLPTKDGLATIKHAVTVNNVCGAGAKAGRVDIAAGGKLTIAGSLEVWGSVTVQRDGLLEGSRGEILFHVADDRISSTVSPDPAMPDYKPGDVGLWVLGQCHLTGPKVTSWARAFPQSQEPTPLKYGVETLPAIIGGSAKLDPAPEGWIPGDTLVLTSLDGKSITTKLTAVWGDMINFEDVAFTAPAMRSNDRCISPVIGNLSRRLVIASADVTDAEPWHRAHTMAMHGGCCQLDGVEFRDLGARQKLGRYPVHFHKMGVSPCCRCAMSSMWSSVADGGGNRFISVHDTSSVTVSDNIGFRCHGHGFFSETGNEADNAWTGNLSIDVSGREEVTPVADSVTRDGTLILGASNTGNAASSHFWLRTGSTIENNVAVGGTAEFGVMMHPTKIKTAPATTPVKAFSGHGIAGWTLWTNYNDAEFSDLVSTHARLSATSTSFIYPFVNGLALRNPMLLLDGAGDVTPTEANYIGGIALNLQPTCVVTGGVIATKVAVNIHYSSGLTMTGTRINAPFLLDPTYWQGKAEWTIDGCDMTITDRLFRSIYPIEQPLTTLRITNSAGEVGGKSVNGRFTHGKAMSFMGVPEAYGAIRIDE